MRACGPLTCSVSRAVEKWAIPSERRLPPGPSPGVSRLPHHWWALSWAVTMKTASVLTSLLVRKPIPSREGDVGGEPLGVARQVGELGELELAPGERLEPLRVVAARGVQGADHLVDVVAVGGVVVDRRALPAPHVPAPADDVEEAHRVVALPDHRPPSPSDRVAGPAADRVEGEVRRAGDGDAGGERHGRRRRRPWSSPCRSRRGRRGARSRSRPPSCRSPPCTPRPARRSG